MTFHSKTVCDAAEILRSLSHDLEALEVAVQRLRTSLVAAVEALPREVAHGELAQTPPPLPEPGAFLLADAESAHPEQEADLAGDIVCAADDAPPVPVASDDHRDDLAETDIAVAEIVATLEAAGSTAPERPVSLMEKVEACASAMPQDDESGGAELSEDTHAINSLIKAHMALLESCGVDVHKDRSGETADAGLMSATEPEDMADGAACDAGVPLAGDAPAAAGDTMAVRDVTADNVSPLTEMRPKGSRVLRRAGWMMAIAASVAAVAVTAGLYGYIDLAALIANVTAYVETIDLKAMASTFFAYASALLDLRAFAG